MKLAFHHNIKFCPHCGVEALERDWYKQAPPAPGGGGEKGVKQVANGMEFICRLCGFGFRIGKSARWHTVEDLHKQERRLRNSVTFDTQCVGTEIASAFLAENPLRT
jgi:ribosomal protein L37E